MYVLNKSEKSLLKDPYINGVNPIDIAQINDNSR